MYYKFLALLLFAGVTLFAELPPQLINARKLVEGIEPADNSYAHRIDVELKRPDGSGRYVCHTDCSGLINALLMYSYGLSRPELDELFQKKRPLARTYYDHIASEHGFHRVPFIWDTVPGDIIAVKFPPHSKNTGHVMMIDGFPARRTSTPPIIENTIQWAVPIIDCTGHAHGRNDTRYIAPGESRHGVGRGVIRLYSDLQGHVVGYTWSVGHESMFESCRERQVAIGRFKAYSLAGRE